LTDKNIVKLEKIINLADSDSFLGYEIIKYILNNSEIVYSFLDKHSLPKLFFIPIGSVFYLLSLTDSERKASAQLKDNKFKTKYKEEKLILMGLKMHKSLQKKLGTNEEKINHILSAYNQILDIPLPIRYNDKNILKEKLNKVFIMFMNSGLRQKEQINIIIDLFEQENFEDYKEGWTKERFDRVRKSFYEPALKLYQYDYGK